MKHINISTFKKILEVEGSNDSIDFINVCTPVEYSEKHISGVRSVPLDELPKHLKEFQSKKTIYIHCRSGKRGEKAVETLEKMGVSAELVNVEGGLLAWEEAGFQTLSLLKKGKLPLMRQVFLTAGLLVLIGQILFFVFGSKYFLILSLFVGAGLTFSGLSGWCGLQILLSKMPWNKQERCG